MLIVNVRFGSNVNGRASALGLLLIIQLEQILNLIFQYMLDI